MKNIITATILSLSIMSCSSSEPEQDVMPPDEWFTAMYSAVGVIIVVIENTKNLIDEEGITDSLHENYVRYASACRMKTEQYNDKSINYDEAFFEMLELPKSLILTNCY